MAAHGAEILVTHASRTQQHFPMPHDSITTSDATRPGYTLVILTALAALSYRDRQVLAVLIQPIKAEFSLSDLQISLVTGLGFALTFGVLGVPLGRLADGRERRSLIAVCRAFGGLLAAVGAAFVGFWSLMLTRAGGGLGALLALVLGSWLAQKFGWRTTAAVTLAPTTRRAFFQLCQPVLQD